jgi:hypothetical protein
MGRKIVLLRYFFIKLNCSLKDIKTSLRFEHLLFFKYSFTVIATLFHLTATTYGAKSVRSFVCDG